MVGQTNNNNNNNNNDAAKLGENDACFEMPNELKLHIAVFQSCNFSPIKHYVASMWGSMTTFTDSNIECKSRNGFGNNESYFIGGICKELQDLVAKSGLWSTIPATPATSNLHELSFLKNTTNACCLNGVNLAAQRTALQQSTI